MIDVIGLALGLGLGPWALGLESGQGLELET